MPNLFQKMAIENPSYPIRMGQGWSEDEDRRLLKSINQQKSINIIADEHQRTVGGIKARQRSIAADYYFNDKVPIDTIMKYTGLNRTQVEDTIQKREALQVPKKVKVKDDRNQEVIELLTLINQKLDVIIENRRKLKFE